MDAAESLSNRIPDPTLRKHALEAPDEPVSVLIELALPKQKIEYERDHRGGELPRPSGVELPGKREEGEIERTAFEAREFLEQLLENPPVYLRSARGFAATVTGSELREIAGRPFVKSIEPNRTLPS